ncbi:MAG: PEP-CTERM sorting domain-containing protein [Phycisphaerales bacterium]|nr:PEP-CTERM sorting domain-containing protein [Phycisphaerales bacterium]
MRRINGCLPVIAMTIAGTAGAEIIVVPIVLEGDMVPGVGEVTGGFSSVAELDVNNSGYWIVETDTTNPNTDTDSALVRGLGFSPMSLYLQEGQALSAPVGAMIDAFDAVTVNNLGQHGFNFFLDGTSGSSDDSGVYYNTSLVIQESTISTAPQFTPGTPYTGWFDVKINNGNQLFTMASVDDPNIETTTDRAMVRIDNPGGAFTETVYVKEADILNGFAVNDFGTGPHDFAWSDSGVTLFTTDLETGSSLTDGHVYMSDGTTHTFLLREGDPSGIEAGRNWGTLYGASLGMNNSSDWVMMADLDGSTSDDKMILKNGTEIIAREGFSLDSIGGTFTFTSFGTGAVEIDDNGSVFWFGDWNDPDTTRDEGLFMNDQLIIQEGVTLVDGSTLLDIYTGESNFQISENGQWLIFEGELQDGRNGAFLALIPEPGSMLLLLGGMSIAARRRR